MRGLRFALSRKLGSGKASIANHTELTKYIADLANLQQQRKEATNQQEAQRYTTTIEHAQLVLERLYEQIGK